MVAGVILVALLVYTLTGGADFGGGVLDVFARGRTGGAQRTVIDNAMGPVWEANHVWLILVIVLMFVCFPVAFAAVSTVLHIPLTLMLIGIVLRGTAFVFRHYDQPRWHQSWSRVFALASVWTPFFLGVSLGAVASGSFRFDATNHVQTNFISEWLAPFPLSVGAFTVALFTLLAATYLTVEAQETGVREAFRRRALAATLLTAGCAYVSLALAASGAPTLFTDLTQHVWSWVFQAITLALGGSLTAMLWTRRYKTARTLVVLLVIAIELGWAASHVPYILPPELTLLDAAAPRNILVNTLRLLGLGSVVLVPSFVVLYRVFKGPRFWSLSQ
ncbi:MAG: cytochrome d ubiquinol oxidase subunit II [Myxococcota bacterium]|jgi:cytochrome d ubiquinol oxidase subunit II